MSLKEKFIFNFIDDGRWHYIVDGLKVTLEVTFFAVLLGIALGVIIAIIRSTYDKNKSSMRGFSKFIVVLLNFICKIYLTVIYSIKSTSLIYNLCNGVWKLITFHPI